MPRNRVGGIFAFMPHIHHIVAVARIVAHEHLQFRIAERVDILIILNRVFIIIDTKQKGLFHLFFRARRNLGTTGVGATTIPTSASYIIIAVEVEIILQLLTITLTSNGSEVGLAIMDDFSTEVAVIDA